MSGTAMTMLRVRSQPTRGFGVGESGSPRGAPNDGWLCDDELGLYVVTEGLGGARRAAVASRAVVLALVESLHARRPGLDRAQSRAERLALTRWLRSALDAASDALQEAAVVEQLDLLSCSFAAVLRARDHLLVAHAGDCRVYRCREGALRRVTRDHTVAEATRSAEPLPAWLRAHPGFVTRSLVAGRAVDAELQWLGTRPGDRFLLSTSSLHPYVARTPTALLERLIHGAELTELPGLLVERAFAFGDEGAISVVAVDVT